MKIEEENIYYFIPNPSQELPLSMLIKEGGIFGSNQMGKTKYICVKAVMLCAGIHPLQRTGLFPKPPIHGRITASDREHGIEDIIEPILSELAVKAMYQEQEKNNLR